MIELFIVSSDQDNNINQFIFDTRVLNPISLIFFFIFLFSFQAFLTSIHF